MEDLNKLEEVLGLPCADRRSYDSWRTESPPESPFYSKKHKAQCDFLPTEKARMMKKAASIRCSHIRRPPSRSRSFGLRYDHPFLPNELVECIKKSRQITQLQDDWDGEGSPGYSNRTWERAIQFLLSNALRFLRKSGIWIAVPRILPGPDGSIDLHWKTPKRELLINIPRDPSEAANYYGDDTEDQTNNAIRGRNLDTSKPHTWIFEWLMR